MRRPLSIGMEKTTRKQTRMVVYAIMALALCLGLGWLGLLAAEQAPNALEYSEDLSATAQNVLVPGNAGDPVSSLKIYAVNVFHRTPFEKTFIGGGTYLGNGMVLTAFHVAGSWRPFQKPRVLIAGQDLPATIIKNGSLETVDLALLSVDKSRLPISLRLRRNPICQGALKVGTSVFIVTPKSVKRSTVISPMAIVPRFRKRFGSLISEPAGSGSGVFDANRKCLLGIISRKVEKYGYEMRHGRLVFGSTGFAGYFVSAKKIRGFIPQKYRSSIGR